MSQQQPKTEQENSGYTEALFEGNKVRWTDEHMGGGSVEKTDKRYHDKVKTLKIVNGLCQDIFFRAEDIEKEKFESIPDFSEPVPGYTLADKKREHKKPLDSPHRKRTYTISKELPPPSRPAPRQAARGGKDMRRPRRRRR